MCALTTAPAPAAAQADSIASKRLRQLILLGTPEVAARRSAVEADEAALQGARLRLRPFLMTALAASIGVAHQPEPSP